MILNKRIYAGLLAAGLLPVMHCAMAGDAAPTDITIEFTGSVKAPTCTIDSKTLHSVSLDEINLNKVSTLPVGAATDEGENRFTIYMNCPDQINQNNVSLKIEGGTDSASPTLLTNTDNDTDAAKGLGFELFSAMNGSATALKVDNSEVPSADYAPSLNNGTDNLDFIVKYAKEASTVTAGHVASKATFTFTYK